MPLELIKSSWGKDLLIVDNCTFRVEKVVKERTIWKCTEYKKNRCLARCHTVRDAVVKQMGDHNHVPSKAKVEARKVMLNVKESASSSTMSTKALVDQETCTAVPSTVGQLPGIENIKQTVRRVRRKAQAPYPNPTSLDDLVFPEACKTTISGEPFLSFDSGQGTPRFVIFATERGLDLLNRCDEWYCDGTFKVSPPLFNQLYTIHGLKFGTVFPAVYVLMSDRSASTYILVLTELKKMRSTLNPRRVTTDFEQASLLAFRTVLPGTVQAGCFFHFSQCLWRKIQQIPEIARKYVDDPEFALGVRLLAAVAFVPIDSVIPVFEELLESVFFQDNADVLRDFVNYFEDTWIGRPGRRRGRAAPIFPIQLWNVHERVIDNVARTNDHGEGWDRGFSSLLAASHPSIWRFVEGLKKEENLNKVRLEQFNAGEEHRGGRKVYRDLCARIRSVVSDFGNRPTVDYLRGIAHNIELQV